MREKMLSAPPVVDNQWQIKQINPEPLDFVYNTPLTIVTGFVGAGLFFSTVIAVTVFEQPIWLVLIGIAGLVLAVVGRLYAARFQQKNWIQVDAKCIALEYGKVINPKSTVHTKKYFWAFSLLCEFQWQGQTHEITPLLSGLTFAVNNLENKRAYFRKTMDVDGSCKLWINPDDLSEGCYHEKKRIDVSKTARISSA